jgi:DnaK suppressor protein
VGDPGDTALRDRLEGERERVREQIRRLGPGDESLEFDENFADSGQVTAERGEAEALAGQLVETLSEIDDALSKLEAGTYGDCEQCHQPIGEARLAAVPTARLCMTCASRRR